MISTISDRPFNDEQFPTRTSNYFPCANACSFAACSNIPASDIAGVFKHCHVGSRYTQHISSKPSP